jgi:iron complex outermembrane receptor protein
MKTQYLYKTAIACGLASICSGYGAASVAQEQGLQLEEVVVTARKREESLQDVPLAVTSLSAELRRSTIRDLKDLEGLAPNFVVDSVMGVPGGAAISIRGVSYQETEKTLDPSIGMVLDGIYLGSNAGQILDNFDIARLEVLRGPQGTLFGKNTIGGVINVQRTLPTMEWGGKISGTLASHGQEDLKGVLNMPLGDRTGLKVFGSTLNSDGYVENLDGKDVGGQDYTSYGFSVLSQATENLDIQFTYENTDDDTDAGAWANFATADYLVCIFDPVACPPDGSGETTTTTNDRNHSSAETDSYNLKMNWDIGAGVITSITGYRESEEHTRSEFDASQAAFNAVTNNKDFEQFSQEIRFTSQASDTLQYVAGLYYWDTDLKQDYVSEDIAFYLDLIGFYYAPDGRYGFANAPANGIVPGTTVPFGAIQRSDQSQDTTSYAAFFQGDWTFATNWKLTFGGRYTYEEKDYTAAQQQIQMSDGQWWTPFIGPNAGGAPQRAYFPDDDDWSEFTPKIGIAYDINEDSMAYASYSEGFKSGGFFGRLADYRIDTTYDPEYVDTYELGYRSSWLDSRAIANVTLFYSDYSDKQEEVIIGGGNTTVQNAADVEMFGVEVEGQMQVTAAWSVQTAIGYLDSEYDKFEYGGEDVSHLNLRNAPEWTFSAGTSYILSLGDGDMAFNLNYRWIDEYDTNLLNGELGKQDSHENLDLSVDYSFMDHYRVSVYGRNLTDEKTRRVVDIPGLEAFGQYSMGDNYGIEFIADF